MNKVSDLYVKRVSFVKRGAVRDPQNPSEPRRRLLWKAEGGAPDNTTAKGGDQVTTTEQELREAVQKAERERDEALRKAEQAEEELAKASKKSDNDDDDGDEGEKGERDSEGKFVKSELPEPVRVALEKAEKEAADLRKTAQEAQELAKEERDLRLTREFIAKAEQEMPLIGAPADMGPILLKTSSGVALTKEEHEKLHGVLKAASEQIARGDLFKEMGTAYQASGAKDAYAEALAKAEDARKSDASLSKSAAMAHVLESDPDLRRRVAAAEA